MNSTEYIKHVKRTESPSFDMIEPRLLHGIIGVSTEAGELLDIIKKSLFYGRTVDVAHVKEEVGDSLWYLGVICDVLGCTFEELMDENVAKLRHRYPEQFKDVVERDYAGEREAAEGLKEHYSPSPENS